MVGKEHEKCERERKRRNRRRNRRRRRRRRREEKVEKRHRNSVSMDPNRPSAVPSSVLNSTEKGRSDCPVVTTLKVAKEPSATV